MELPITRPSQMSYADEIDFGELLGELKSKRYNGFIRVTSGPSEGYILFDDGKQCAASFEDYLKMDAIEKMKSIVDDSKTLIELFDLKESQMKYLIEVNKFFVIDVDSKAEDILLELKNNEKTERDIKEVTATVIEETVEKEIEIEPENIPQSIPEKKTEEVDDKQEIKEKLKAISNNGNQSISDKKEEIKIEPPVSNDPKEEELKEKKAPVVETLIEEKGEEPDKPDYQKENEFVEPGVEAETVNREELMKKYGLKDVAEEEVDNILETYKGGTLSDDDVEKIELTLMNKVKKSILGIPKIKGTEVMVFLDNAAELKGNINIITEYETKGLLSRIMGESRDLENLKRQIINITQIEIKKSFRGYPQIVDDFEINVEVT